MVQQRQSPLQSYITVQTLSNGVHVPSLRSFTKELPPSLPCAKMAFCGHFLILNDSLSSGRALLSPKIMLRRKNLGFPSKTLPVTQQLESWEDNRDSILGSRYLVASKCHSFTVHFRVLRVPQEAPTSILKTKLKLEYGVGNDGKKAGKFVKSRQLLAEVHHQSALLFSLLSKYLMKQERGYCKARGKSQRWRPQVTEQEENDGSQLPAGRWARNKTR